MTHNACPDQVTFNTREARKNRSAVMVMALLWSTLTEAGAFKNRKAEWPHQGARREEITAFIIGSPGDQERASRKGRLLQLLEVAFLLEELQRSPDWQDPAEVALGGGWSDNQCHLWGLVRDSKRI